VVIEDPTAGRPSTGGAPPVVAVMVVHEPGPWFDEVLDSIARQDYPNLRLLFLVTGPPTGARRRRRSACNS